MFDNFRNEWLGRRIDFDHVYAFQCVDLILQYIYENYGINGAYGNAIDWWNSPDGKLLNKFYRDASSQANQGDIVVLNGLPGNPYGHIGIATGGVDATNVEILEQNGNTGSGDGVNGNQIRTRYVARSRVAGLLRPIPAAPTPPPEVHPYTIEAIAPKQVIINKPTHRWGMTYDNFTAIANNPLRDVTPGEIITVTAVCHHSIGYNYYLPDANEPSGYNTLDCDDYSIPPPPPPEPVVLPAPPTAPVTAPTSEQYEVIKTIPGYMTSNRAANHISPNAEIEAGVYFVFNRVNDMLNVTKVQGQPNSWINPNDNVPDPEPVPKPAAPSPWVDPRATEPAPEPEPAYVPTAEHPTEWKASNHLLYSDGRPELYISTNLKPVKVYDMDRGHDPITLQPNTELHIVSIFEKDGVVYARAKKVALKGLWYGIPLTILRSYNDIYSYQKTLADRVATDTKKLSDYPTLWFATLKKLFDKIFKIKETN